MMPLGWKQIEVELRDCYKQQDAEDGTQTFDRVLVIVTKRQNGAEIIDAKLFGLERIEESEHSSTVYGKI